MTTTNNTIEILNDLVEINNDRIVGYEKALNELDENNESLRTVFLAMIDESRKIKMNLGNEIQVGGETIESGTTNRGKVFRVWMDIKAAFTGHNAASILDSCEYGEDAAQKAYESALEEKELPQYVRTMIEEQKATLKQSHDKIKHFRDSSL